MQQARARCWGAALQTLPEMVSVNTDARCNWLASERVLATQGPGSAADELALAL